MNETRPLPRTMSSTDRFMAVLIEEVRGLRGDIADIRGDMAVRHEPAPAPAESAPEPPPEVQELRTVRDGAADPEVRQAARQEPKRRKPAPRGRLNGD